MRQARGVQNPVIPSKSNQLTVSNHATLPQVCIATGASDVPLQAGRWEFRRNGVLQASLTYFLTPEEMAKRDANKGPYRIFLGATLLLLPVWMAMAFIASINYSSAVTVISFHVGAGLLFVFFAYKTFKSWWASQHCFPRHNFWDTNKVTLSHLPELAVHKISALMPKESAPSSAVKYRTK